jgi:hypothetical protein
MRSKPEFSERTVPSIIAKRPAVALPAVDDDEEDDDEPELEEVAPVVTEICCCCCRNDEVNNGERCDVNCWADISSTSACFTSAASRAAASAVRWDRSVACLRPVIAAKSVAIEISPLPSPEPDGDNGGDDGGVVIAPAPDEEEAADFLSEPGAGFPTLPDGGVGGVS